MNSRYVQCTSANATCRAQNGQNKPPNAWGLVGTTYVHIVVLQIDIFAEKKRCPYLLEVLPFAPFLYPLTTMRDS